MRKLNSHNTVRVHRDAVMTTKQREATNRVAAQGSSKSARAKLLGKLDLKRILAMSAVLVMHTMGVGLMLLPAAPIAAIALPPPESAWVDVNPAPPPPPKPPVEPPIRPLPKVQPVVVAAPPPLEPPIATPIQVATTREPSPEIGSPIAPTIVDLPATVSGDLGESVLKVLRAPAPQFPNNLIRAGFSGTVEFSVFVGVDGSAQEIKLLKSSGNHKLDQSTLSHIKRRWLFKAPEVDGKTVPGWGRGKITFTMEG